MESAISSNNAQVVALDAATGKQTKVISDPLKSVSDFTVWGDGYFLRQETGQPGSFDGTLWCWRAVAMPFGIEGTGGTDGTDGTPLPTLLFSP